MQGKVDIRDKEVITKTIDDIKLNCEFTLQKDCDKYRPIYYAGAGGDFNPIHIDPEFGKMVGLGGNILQGLCTFAWVSQIVTDWLEDPGRMKKLRARFRNPVRPNDTVTIKGRVNAKEGNRVTCELTATNQDGAEVITNGLAEAEF